MLKTSYVSSQYFYSFLVRLLQRNCFKRQAGDDGSEVILLLQFFNLGKQPEFFLNYALSAAYTVEKTVYTAAVAGGDDLKR